MIPTCLQALFDDLDLDGDGRMSPKELRQALKKLTYLASSFNAGTHHGIEPAADGSRPTRATRVVPHPHDACTCCSAR